MGSLRRVIVISAGAACSASLSVVRCSCIVTVKLDRRHYDAEGRGSSSGSCAGGGSAAVSGTVSSIEQLIRAVIRRDRRARVRGLPARPNVRDGDRTQSLPASSCSSLDHSCGPGPPAFPGRRADNVPRDERGTMRIPASAAATPMSLPEERNPARVMAGTRPRSDEEKSRTLRSVGSRRAAGHRLRAGPADDRKAVPKGGRRGDRERRRPRRDRAKSHWQPGRQATGRAVRRCGGGAGRDAAGEARSNIRRVDLRT